MLAMGSDDHSAFAICTIQRDVFDLRVVTQYIGQKDKEKGASKNDANATQKGCPFGHTMRPFRVGRHRPKPNETAVLAASQSSGVGHCSSRAPDTTLASGGIVKAWIAWHASI